jgi:hypothetical protein
MPWECVSETTGTRWRTTLRITFFVAFLVTVVFVAVAFSVAVAFFVVAGAVDLVVADGVAFGRASGGVGAGAWTRGTSMRGKAAAGMRSGGRAALRDIAGSLNATAIGATYANPSTARPRPAHQYRIPLRRSATKPYG